MTIVNYQSTRRTQGLYKLYGLYKLSTDLIDLFSVKIPEQRQPIRDSVRSKLNTNLLIFQIYEKKHRMDSFL